MVWFLIAVQWGLAQREWNCKELPNRKVEGIGLFSDMKFIVCVSASGMAQLLFTV